LCLLSTGYHHVLVLLCKQKLLKFRNILVDDGLTHILYNC
jgi:hypothetical protein